MRYMLVFVLVMVAGCTSNDSTALNPPARPGEHAPRVGGARDQEVFRLCERLLATSDLVEHNALLREAVRAAPRSRVVSLCVGHALQAQEEFGVMKVTRVSGGAMAARGLDPELLAMHADRLIALVRPPTNLSSGAIETYYYKDVAWPAFAALANSQLAPEQQLAVLEIARRYGTWGHLVNVYKVLDSQADVPEAVVKAAEDIAAPLDAGTYKYVHAVVARLRKKL